MHFYQKTKTHVLNGSIYEILFGKTIIPSLKRKIQHIFIFAVFIKIRKLLKLSKTDGKTLEFDEILRLPCVKGAEKLLQNSKLYRLRSDFSLPLEGKVPRNEADEVSEC